MNRYLLKSIVAGTLALCGAMAHAVAPIVADGDFSTPVVFNISGPWYNGGTSPTLTSGPSGFAFLDGTDMLYQSVSLHWGTTYTLSFQALGSGFVQFYDTDLNLYSPVTNTSAPVQAFSNASFGPASFTFTFGTPAVPCNQCAYLTSHLKFSVNGTGAAIDNVQITAVPEPETYAMMLAGLGAVGFMARRRKGA